MMQTFNKDLQQNTTPSQALNILKEGNERFSGSKQEKRDLFQQVDATKDGQWPFAVILSCIDSRTSSELIFDLGIGDVFNVRIAGNIVNEDILGSMEFACKAAGAKLIVVLGHTKCGAIKGACDHVELGNLTALLNKIEPAVKEEESTKENRTSNNAEFVENVAEINVKRNVKEIMKSSSILKEMIDNGEIGIVGGMYNLNSGRVDFYNDVTIIKDKASASASVA